MNKLIEQLSTVLNVDAEILQNAYTGDKPVELQEYLRLDEVETLKSNLQKTKYEEGKVAGIEMTLKELKRKYNEAYSIETEGIKSFDVLFDKVLDKVNSDHKAKIKEITSQLDSGSQEKIQSYENKLIDKDKEKKKLQEEIERLKSEADEKVREINEKYKSEKVNTLISTAFQSLQFDVPKHIENLGVEEVNKFIHRQKINAINLFKLDYTVDFDESGQPFIMKGKEPVKDKLQNNEKLENIVMPFCRENFIGLTENLNGRAQRSGAANISMNLKGLSLEQLDEIAKEKGIKQFTKEYDTLYAEYSKSNE